MYLIIPIKILPNVKYSYLFAFKTITIIVTKFKNNSACY